MVDNKFEIERPDVEPVKIITIEDVPYAVDNMSDEVQEMVKIFNRWNDKEADKQYEINLLADDISMIRAAKDTVSRQILEKVREENASKEAEDETQPSTEDTPQ